MAAEPTTAAEKTAPAGSMVMLGDVLGLGRGGSGCRASGGPGGPGAVDLAETPPALRQPVLRRYGASADSCFAQIWITGYRGVFFRHRGRGGRPDLRITLLLLRPRPYRISYMCTHDSGLATSTGINVIWNQITFHRHFL